MFFQSPTLPALQKGKTERKVKMIFFFFVLFGSLAIKTVVWRPTKTWFSNINQKFILKRDLVIVYWVVLCFILKSYHSVEPLCMTRLNRTIEDWIITSSFYATKKGTISKIQMSIIESLNINWIVSQPEDQRWYFCISPSRWRYCEQVAVRLGEVVIQLKGN